MKISIIIPVYNEVRTIRQILERAAALAAEKEILVVDDGSTDGTREVLEEAAPQGAKVIVHEGNWGKGAAVRTALEYVEGDVVVILDADLEYDPRECPALLAPILQGDADAVYGSRFLGGPHRVLYFWHYLGNTILTFLSNMLSDLNLSDMETGYKAFRTSVLKSIELESDRFGFEPEVTAKVARRGFRIYEVPISYRGRDYAAGKKITWRDGLAAVFHIVRFHLIRRRPRPKRIPHHFMQPRSSAKLRIVPKESSRV